ncbi:helix-turn-helix transcriptional regulator [Thalassotalea psychrophila]|uniref:Helix-turn-helix transcriptional regulator n=1 Tax=Thalassotalea psychrophila TaxID=3065647 RepID=A0ABY9U350_9GAMM|nr:helix-turn-helix transcriptional regulator [Colwelliaceae bacterium SQ149]
MKNLHLIDRSNAFPLIRFLQMKKAPVELLLSQANLPIALLENNQEYVATYPLWKLFDLASDYLQVTDLGFLVDQAEGDSVVEPLYSSIKADALSLHDALRLLIERVKEISTHAKLWLSYQNKGVWLFGGHGEIDVDGLVQMEQFTLALWVRYIRKYIGSGWSPEAITLHRYDKGEAVKQRFSNALITQDQHKVGVFINNEQLGEANPELALNFEHHVLADDNFSDKLYQALKSFNAEGFPTLEQSVSILGLSRRQIQRRLAKEGSSFKQVLQQVRFDSAIHYLENSELKIHQIAEALGYTVHSHFSRAFQKWTGVTPIAYRIFKGNKKDG